MLIHSYNFPKTNSSLFPDFNNYKEYELQKKSFHLFLSFDWHKKLSYHAGRLILSQ
jgi:hypothetical protein